MDSKDGMTKIELHEEILFPSAVYFCDFSHHLSAVKAVSNAALADAKKKNGDNGVLTMSEDFTASPKLDQFRTELADIFSNVLSGQGYQPNSIQFNAMWTQEHKFMSSMEQHVHGGFQVVAFYCLDVPDDSSRLIFHDPRPAKVQVNLPERDMSVASIASQSINYKLVPGRLFIAPSWLPHSFTRNMSKKPVRFVHINASVGVDVCNSNVEVV
jgi:hypothetical protein